MTAVDKKPGAAPGRRKPPMLRPGDTVALVSPASPFHRGPGTPENTVARARRALHALGLRTVVGERALNARGYLAGADGDRARDLNDAFADPDVDAIVCLSGGYGTPRLLDLLDYDVIAANPKVFVGYSDITALHTAIGQQARLVTFHGPMGFELARLGPALGPSETGGDAAAPSAAAAFTWRWFGRAFMEPDPLGELPVRAPWQAEPVRPLVSGVARGPLVGGNLSLLAATLGTPYEIDAADNVLLIEEVGEAPYRVDRMLTQLRLAGKLDAAAGFIFAEWTDCVPSDPARPSLSLEQVLEDIVVPLGKPTVVGLAAGHGPGRFTLPLGVPVTVDGNTGRVVVEEAGVTGPAAEAPPVFS